MGFRLYWQQQYVFSVSKVFWSRRLACATRDGGRKQSWPLFSPTFSPFFSFFFLHLLLFTHFGETPAAEILFPPYFEEIYPVPTPFPNPISQPITSYIIIHSEEKPHWLFCLINKVDII